jgi:cellulose synthase/poly-beta-1,6-N-acetylglucosamine synthase-like glycosyltransferase
MRLKKIKVSVGVFCHNEARFIKTTLEALLKSKTERIAIVEIIVISSGSWDKTNKIITSLARCDKRVRLVIETERSGKSSAINHFIRLAHADVLVSLSGDLRVHKQAIEEIALPFFDPQVGMVGAHPVPTNVHKSVVGKELQLMWELHHRISLRQPKCGEMVAFRNVIHRIPQDSAVDEATLEVLLKIIGFTVMYAPMSIVYNKVPLTLNDFLVQRRRVEAGHLWLDTHYNYQVVTMNYARLLEVLIDYLQENPASIVIVIRLLLLECLSRFLGWMDYRIFHKNPFVWQMVKR